MDASLNYILYVYSKVFLKGKLKNVVIKGLFTRNMNSTDYRREFSSFSVMSVSLNVILTSIRRFNVSFVFSVLSMCWFMFLDSASLTNRLYIV